jgi:phosphatidylserine/phosphatidylglycerophosphate/cardiolipin synthase-like enzyme
MKLLVEPEGGIAPILNAIKHARKTIEILIVRLDCRSVTRSLETAVARGVVVRVIIASKHRGGTRDLRKLELRLWMPEPSYRERPTISSAITRK